MHTLLCVRMLAAWWSRVCALIPCSAAGSTNRVPLSCHVVSLLRTHCTPTALLRLKLRCWAKGTSPSNKAKTELCH